MQDHKMNQDIHAVLRQAKQDRAAFLRAFFARLFDRKPVAVQTSRT